MVSSYTSYFKNDLELRYLLPAGVLVSVGGVSRQAVLPAVPISAAVLGNELSADGALVGASVVRFELGEHVIPEGIEFTHNITDNSTDVAGVAAVHVADVGVLPVAASVVMSEHFVELAVVSALKLKK